MAKFCRECGKELEENSKFCKNCGTKIEEEKTEEANTSNENTNESAASNAGTNVTYNQTYVTKKSNGMAIAGFVRKMTGTSQVDAESMNRICNITCFTFMLWIFVLVRINFLYNWTC